MLDIELSQPNLLRTQAYVDGQWVGADSGATLDVINPATGEVLTRVADLGLAETERAVAAAKRAQLAWAKTTAKHRANILRRWFDLIMAAQEDLARLMTLEQGKVIAESRLEIAYGASFVEWFAEEAKRMYGDVIPHTADGKRFMTMQQPVGVVSAVTPWNFPNAMITRKAAPALAAGCAIVIKPSELTPLSALALAALAEEAGIPAGLFNVVVGTDAAAIGEVLTTHPDIRKFSFTGSTAVGKRLIAQCASTVKKVSMELGGNAPFLVFDDADLDAAVNGVIASKFRNAGQTCICANRVLVQEGIYDAFVDRFATRLAEFTMGNGLQESTTLGPLISSAAQTKVTALIDDAITKGAQRIGGEVPLPKRGTFVAPVALTGITAQMRVTREEIFGPVAPIFRFKNEAEAIALANDTPYGLASYVFARDIGRVIRVAEGLEYGMVGFNDVAITGESIPFGGIKESGLGREGSKYGLQEYTELKYICLGGVDAPAERQS